MNKIMRLVFLFCMMSLNSLASDGLSPDLGHSQARFKILTARIVSLEIRRSNDGLAWVLQGSNKKEMNTLKCDIPVDQYGEVLYITCQRYKKNTVVSDTLTVFVEPGSAYRLDARERLGYYPASFKKERE